MSCKQADDVDPKTTSEPFISEGPNAAQSHAAQVEAAPVAGGSRPARFPEPDCDVESMRLLWPLLVYLLIVRTSIKVGHHPIGYSLLYGLVAGFAALLGSGGFTTPLLIGAVAALLCAAILWLLERFDERPLVWWPVFVVGVPMPIWIQIFV